MIYYVSLFVDIDSLGEEILDQKAFAAPLGPSAPPYLAFDLIEQTFSATFLNIASIPVPSFAETSDQIIWFC